MRKFAAGILVVAVLSAGLWSAANLMDQHDDSRRASGVITQMCIKNRSLSFRINGEHYHTDGRDPGLNLALVAACSHELRVTVGVTPSGGVPGLGDDAGGTSRQITSCHYAPSKQLDDLLPYLQFELLQICAPLILT